MADDVLRKVAEEGRERLKAGKRLVNEFKTFILRGNAIDLAVGVVMGAAFNGFVQAIVSGLLTPLIIQADAKTLEDEFWHVLGIDFKYGLVLASLINLVLVGAAVYFFVVRPMNKLRDRLKAGEPDEAVTRECPECLSKIPVAASRCAFCTAKVGAAA